MENNNKTVRQPIFYHIVYWALYILYEQLLVLIYNRSATQFINYVFYYTCNIALFYWHFSTLNRSLLHRPIRYFYLFSSLIAEITIVLAVKVALDYYSFRNAVPPHEFSERLKTYAALDLYRNIYYMFFSTVIWSALNFGRFIRETTNATLKQALAEKANSDLQYQFAQAQNAFLKQQINPHLLFNTLNAIYSTVYQHSPKDSEAVLLLSDIMRYSYEEPDSQGLVSLESELYQLKNLIKLNTFRFRNTIKLDLKIEGDPKELRVIPLVLLTLTENMFKHGNLQHSPGSIAITIDEDRQLTYTSKNTPKLHRQTEANSHVGLNNTRLRLDYAYMGNYQLDTTQTEELFTVNLQINLAYERSNH